MALENVKPSQDSAAESKETELEERKETLRRLFIGFSNRNKLEHLKAFIV